MIDADELLERARDAIRTTTTSNYLSDHAIAELASAASIFAAQFAGESLQELREADHG